jgi:polysaccharide chain length determinant protein (PEP-CTERM system associated)
MVLDEARSAWRFRRSALTVAWSVALVGWLGVFIIPAQYESTAKVFVDTNSLLRPLLEGIAVQPSATDQVSLVRRALLSRTQLEQVVSQTALGERVSSDREKEEQIQSLMKQIRIDAGASTPNARDLNMYSIQYMDKDPALAYSVVKTLLDSLVSQSVGANRSNADTAQKFLRGQLDEYEKRLTEAEIRLAEFKRNNMEAMPDERGGYFQRMQGDSAELDRLSSQLTVAVNKRDELRAKLLGGTSATASGTAAIETSVDARILETRQREAEMLLRFTDNHPDIVALRETLQRLEAARAAELEDLRRNQTSLGAPRGSTSLVVQNLQIALNQAELDVTALRSQVLERQQRVSSLRQRITTMPEIEAQLARLNRDYDVTKAEYEKLLQKFEQARISDAADRVEEMRFRVIDQPIQAVNPAKPRRALLVLFVLALAMAAGAAFAFLRSKMMPVIVSARLKDMIAGMPVVARVEQILDEDAARQVRRGYWAVGAGACVLGLCGVALALLTPVIESALRATFLDTGV